MRNSTWSRMKSRALCAVGRAGVSRLIEASERGRVGHRRGWFRLRGGIVAALAEAVDHRRSNRLSRDFGGGGRSPLRCVSIAAIVRWNETDSCRRRIPNTDAAAMLRS